MCKARCPGRSGGPSAQTVRRRMPGCSADSCLWSFNRNALAHGTKVRDKIYAEVMANITASVIGKNRNRPMPGINANGESTRNVHSVETSSGIATSLAPFMAASFGVAPKVRWRCVFSRQMMALSIIGPMASVKPASVITLIVCPEYNRQMIADQHREGQGQNRDDGHAPLPQKKQDHQRAQDRADGSFLHQGRHRWPAHRPIGPSPT